MQLWDWSLCGSPDIPLLPLLREGLVYLFDIVKRLFGHADITDPAVFGPDQHVEDKERERRVRGNRPPTVFVSMDPQ
jgi:hypothetical protein